MWRKFDENKEDELFIFLCTVITLVCVNSVGNRREPEINGRQNLSGIQNCTEWLWSFVLSKSEYHLMFKSRGVIIPVYTYVEPLTKAELHVTDILESVTVTHATDFPCNDDKAIWRGVFLPSR
jgi:hypothetical protein